MAIAIDAMGGDHAPGAAVAAAVEGARQLGTPLVLVGQAAQVEAELAKHTPLPDPGLLRVVHAPEQIGMGESPGEAIRRKPQASILVATELVRDGAAEAVVTAGNSGAAMGAALVKLGRLPHVERPAIATVLPALGGRRVVLLDVGATVDCKPHHLVDFARMGEVYARQVLGRAQPTVGLLSIGEEHSKGNHLSKSAFKLLERSGLRFVGNLEGKDISGGAADVVVCDGFVGNVVLKVMEGFAEMVWSWLAGSAPGDGSPGLLRAVQQRLDYAEYGGALLLGVRGTCVISHGRSTPKALFSAVRVAQASIEQQVLAHLLGAFAGRPTPLRKRRATTPGSASF